MSRPAPALSSTPLTAATSSRPRIDPRRAVAPHCASGSPPPMVIRSPVINVMTSAALKAARGLIRDFGEVEQLQVSVKGPSDFVSSADLRADRTLKTELQRARPGYGLLFEEGGAAEGGDPRHRWIVDPLDGTTNFLHGVPHFSISIALERDGDIVAGVIYDPTRD